MVMLASIRRLCVLDLVPGHVARVCPQGNRGSSSSGHTEKHESKGEMCIDADEECVGSVDVLNTVYVHQKPLSSPILVRVKEAVMELDTGAAVLIIPTTVISSQCLPIDNCSFEDTLVSL